MTFKRLLKELQARRASASANVFRLTCEREAMSGSLPDSDIEELDAQIDLSLKAEQFYIDMLFEIDTIIKGDCKQ